jgi:regulator-associated protein of mTOR
MLNTNRPTPPSIQTNALRTTVGGTTAYAFQGASTRNQPSPKQHAAQPPSFALPSATTPREQTLQQQDEQKERTLPCNFMLLDRVDALRVAGGAEQHPPYKVTPWRMRERMKTVQVAIVMCLNIGTDPPDVVKTPPYARDECWIDPLSLPPQKAIERIGQALQSQYERWQARARYKQCLDPTVEDIKKLCLGLRRNARDERVLFHYNGHGVPRPTQNGEIWVFNKDFTQYIPLSVYELQRWIGNPAIYVFDCSCASLLLPLFHSFMDHQDAMFKDQVERNNQAHQKDSDNGGGTGSSGGSGSNNNNSSNSNSNNKRDSSNVDVDQATARIRDCIVLCATSATGTLPTNPDFPADIFTACLTTPIKIALRWFMKRNPLSTHHVSASMLDSIPGRVSGRKTPLGELNWVFTAITDTIAWNVLSRAQFQRLFRQDLLVASLFRNFLLADRIMRSVNCPPVSWPRLPPTCQHPLWDAWDLVAETCLSQLPGMIMASSPDGVHHKNKNVQSPGKIRSSSGSWQPCIFFKQHCILAYNIFS